MKGWSCYVGAAVAALCCAAASCAHAWLEGAKIETAVYVSSSEGSDENPGTREAPLRSFEKIPRKNAGIFLKSGDVFYGPLKGLENCAVDSYGNGAKPVVSGFKRLKNPDAWEMLPGGIWRLDMSRRENFEGHSGGEASAPGCFNNIGERDIPVFFHLVFQHGRTALPDTLQQHAVNGISRHFRLKATFFTTPTDNLIIESTDMPKLTGKP